MNTRIAMLSRRRLLEQDGGGTLFFVVHAGRRPEFLEPNQVPDFHGDEAWFELERVRQPGRAWPTWKVLRQVEAPRQSAGA